MKFPRATRLVICCRGTADEAMTAMRGMMSRLKLTVNETKTRLCRLPEESFDFLGYTIGRCYSPRTGEAYIGPQPSAKKIERLCREISELTDRRWAPRQVEDRGRRDSTGNCRAGRTTSGWARCSRAYRPRGQPRAVPAPPVAEGQVQGPRSGEDTVPRRATCTKTWGCHSLRDGPDALRVRRRDRALSESRMR